MKLQVAAGLASRDGGIYFHRETLTTSVQGRACEALTITSGIKSELHVLASIVFIYRRDRTII